MIFKPSFHPTHRQTDPALWFLFDRDRLLIKTTPDRIRIPDAHDLSALQVIPGDRTYLGELDGQPCFAGVLDPDISLNSQFKLDSLRSLFGRVPEMLIWVAGRANQLLHWNATHRFCGRCGQRMEDKAEERAKRCPSCRHVNYPRLSPAVIVAVIKDKRILLARNGKFRSSFYSVLAGFVEPGETLEECVKREVQEEVGIALKNVRYFGSQPWPFPDSLMIAFVSEYAGGEITVDGSEIIEAAWFAKNELPHIPPKISIARQLIDWFVESG